MFSSYYPEDVTILLKDITGKVTPLPTAEREKRIQNGVHYSEMLPIEYEPSSAYLQTYHQAVKRYSGMTADAVSIVSDRIWNDKGSDVVLISLARAGTSIGILIKHYLEKKYQASIAHYTISIIRGLGIDQNAMAYILARHRPETIQFVDGWTGKGAIQNQLFRAMREFPGIDPGLAVLSDPAHVAQKCGTHDDFLIASSCLNATVSGLLSRTFYRKDIIGPDDFHGAVYYQKWASQDLTYAFISQVEAKFQFDLSIPETNKKEISSALKEVDEICKVFQVQDRNLVKPSIGEATRVLLRRIPWKILVHSLQDDSHLGHLYQLAKEKKVELQEYPLKNYRACGLIRTLADT